VRALEARLGALESKYAQLEALTSRFEALEKSIGTLAETLSKNPQGSELQALVALRDMFSPPRSKLEDMLVNLAVRNIFESSIITREVNKIFARNMGIDLEKQVERMAKEFGVWKEEK